ncbi:MAG: DUF1338 family protein [Opitutales bacterium]|nr:DUF1338 family protein [Opitutales bacterium]
MRLAKSILRKRLFAELSAMYAREVPLYDKLLETVRAVNARVAGESPGSLPPDRSIEEISAERHGAIRLGKPSELRDMARFFACLDMYPVNFYNLAEAGAKSQPVISTAFRPLENADHRIFCSLLMTEGFAPATRNRIGELLAQREIFPPALLRLIRTAEDEGGLLETEAGDFIGQAKHLFSWRGTARDHALYTNLVKARLNIAADIACFPNPHLNHLTPNTLDIDRLHAEMVRRLQTDYAHLQHKGMKETIEGPPRRNAAVLLRQTAYKALDESFRFTEEDGRTVEAVHTARFGEIEQRGAAMTRSGRELYDDVLARSETDPTAWQAIPDDLETLRRERLIHVLYKLAHKPDRPITPDSLDAAVAQGDVVYSPLRYEDFLPVSAAGIFASNLGQYGTPTETPAAPSYSRAQLEGYMEAVIYDAQEGYAREEQASLDILFGQNSQSTL